MRKMTNINQTHISKYLHFGAGSILMLFAFSHLMYLREGLDFDINLPNIVFPWLTNSHLISIVCIFELLISIMCFRYASRDMANVMILFFIAVICWYRWAFHFNGGLDCSCAGALGRKLHLSKSTERAIPIVALILLFMSTLPKIWSLLSKCTNVNKRLIIMVSMLFISFSLFAQQNIEIQGYYVSKSMNFENRQEIKGTERLYSFAAELSGDSWKISAKGPDNHETNGTVTSEMLTYDGTNTYYSTQYTNCFVKQPSDSNDLFTTISPSAIFNVEVDIHTEIYVPWIAFALTPNTVENYPNQAIPLPWHHPRTNPKAFGFQWDTTPSTDGRFIKNCKIIRRHSLDLKDNAELLRPEIDYPVTQQENIQYLEGLELRKQVPESYLEAGYICDNWLLTNKMMIPKTATFYRSMYNPSPRYLRYTNSPIFVVSLEITNVIFRKPAPLLKNPAASTLVYDYRYRTSNIERGFWSAAYVLDSNEAWKSDKDPAILKEASDWLKNGRKYKDFPGKHNYISYIVVLLLCLPVVIFLLGKSKQDNKTTK
jgi:hypothetical protein